MKEQECLKDVTRFMLKPLLQFIKNYENGSEIYKYLYFTRNGSEKIIDAAINKNKNITIVGNPGQGKTSLMHYLFQKYKEDEYKNQLYPIILDYREITPRGENGIIKKFVEKTRYYFDKIINKPINTIVEKTTLDNCFDQLNDIARHMHNLKIHDFKPKLLIFLDDLDYAETEYFNILNKYILAFASSDKCIIVLSARKPLLNNLKKHDQLRLNYYTKPQEVTIPDSDLEFILNNRLKTFINKPKEETVLARFLNLFKSPSLDKRIINILKKEGLLKNENKILGINLPFNSSFYSNLINITYFNIRTIEELFPQFLIYEIKNEGVSFNIDFIGAYIENTKQNENALLDIVSKKTKNVKLKKNNNSIYQLIVENILMGNNIINDNFYSELETYGIDKKEVDCALKVLEKYPYSLIEGEFINGIDNILEPYNTYFITEKGKMYIEEIIGRDEYHNIKRNNGKIEFTKSNRRIYI